MRARNPSADVGGCTDGTAVGRGFLEWLRIPAFSLPCLCLAFSFLVVDWNHPQKGYSSADKHIGACTFVGWVVPDGAVPHSLHRSWGDWAEFPLCAWVGTPPFLSPSSFSPAFCLAAHRVAQKAVNAASSRCPAAPR